MGDIKIDFLVFKDVIRKAARLFESALYLILHGVITEEISLRVNPETYIGCKRYPERQITKIAVDLIASDLQFEIRVQFK